MLDSVKQFFVKIAQSLWGNIESKKELRKFLSLAFIFFALILVYWTLRSAKDSIFNAMVGIDNIPLAKILSAVFVLPLVIFYTKLTEIFQREKVFYTMMALYALGAIVFMFAFMNPDYGLSNTTVSSTRILGWLWYWYIESYGSLIVAAFWVIVTDITVPEAAKRGFPLIYLLGQLGQVVGPFFITAKGLGFDNSAPIPGICAALILLIVVMFWLFMKFTPKDQIARYEGRKIENKAPSKKTGFLEGLRTVFASRYLMAILFIVMVFEIIVTIFDFKFKLLMAAAFPREIDFAAYSASYSYTAGVVSFFCVLFGINNIQSRLGMFASLMVTPLLVLASIILIWTYPVLSTAFWIMVFAKAVNYALNQPSLKHLYIPITKETRYKAVGWIDGFGGRSSKSIGSAINMLKSFFKSKYGAIGLGIFLNVSMSISVALVLVWFFIAFYLGNRHKKAIANNEIVC